jgi:hypothetical protein
MYVEPMVARRDEAAYKYDDLWSTGFSQWAVILRHVNLKEKEMLLR